MAIGIDELYDDDFETKDDTQNQDFLNDTSLESSKEDNLGVISDFLKTKGISDINKIKFEDDNKQIIERSWKDLSREEQFNILSLSVDDPVNDNQPQHLNNQLTDDEIKFINLIRQNNQTPELYLESIKGKDVVQEPRYKVDDLSDDELYLIDLESRVGELSDEQAVEALSVAKQNEDLYKKQIEGIRKEYIERENFQQEQEKVELEQKEHELFLLYQNLIIDAISLFNSVGNLDLNFEDSDKEELAEFMLSQDTDGNNFLYKALQDPQTLVKAAWFILNGDDAFDSVTDYFTNLIKLVSDNQYKKGYQDAKNGMLPTRASVIIDNSKQKTSRSYKTIDDLDDED